MTFSEISSFIWSVADLLRGDYKQSQYGNVILPFTVLRRLDCVLEPTKDATLEAGEKYKGNALADTFIKQAAKNQFYNLSRFTMAKLPNDPDNIKDNLIDYVQRFSPDVEDIFSKFDFFNIIDGLAENDLLFLITEKFCSIDLSLTRVDSSTMGDIYEELIRKFSEMSNETAGEHFSPRDGLKLAVDLLTAESEDDLTTEGRIISVYDPCAGTGGALSIFEAVVKQYNTSADVNAYGQELNAQTYAITKSDIMLKGGNPDNIAYGNTLSHDAFPGATFGYQVSNPPYGVEWKKVETAVKNEHKEKGFAGRFGAGLPRVSDGQLLFVQHMISKMRKPDEGGGRVAVFLNGSPLFTGAAGSGESNIRRWILENDFLEAIIAMPKDFFFNTGIATYIWVLNNTKQAHRKAKVQLIDASNIFTKMRKNLGNKRNEFTGEQIKQIVEMYADFKESETCKIFKTTEFGYTTVTVERPLKDDEGKPVTDSKGSPKPDSKLRDTENIPLGQDIEEYFQKEVVPFAPDAWMDRKKDKIGYEIPFTRYFYKYTPLRPSEEILADIKELEASIAKQLEIAGL